MSPPPFENHYLKTIGNGIDILDQNVVTTIILSPLFGTYLQRIDILGKTLHLQQFHPYPFNHLFLHF